MKQYVADDIKNVQAFLFGCKSIVLACGCFDVLAISHVRHLREAKGLGEKLVVLVTADRYVNKGDDRPIFPDTARAEVISSLKFVDHVVINNHPTAAEAIKMLSVKYFVKGSEYQSRPTPMLLAEQEAVESVGGQLVFTSGPEFHSTEIMRRIMCV